ncbi:MAG: GGDEF domain-containing protein [Deltaproteobacteria bacterium]|nr:GGDEF domain-containing protein [Deltaproteobacteria bacterium]
MARKVRRSDLTETMPIRAQAPADDSSQSGPPQKIPLLLVIAGERVGTRCRLSSPVIAGRDPTADLPLRDAGVSWHHARFEHREDGSTVVQDMGSTNGTFLDGTRVQEALLDDGDQIRLGTTVLKFELVDPVEEGFHAALDKMLNQDDLTGLLHKRRFDAEASLLVEAAVSQEKNLALLVMDLDGVKAINDAHGHHFGAYTISQAGILIGDVIGSRGIATRFGGDEFAAILPDADGRAAVDVAHQILAAVAAHTFEIEGVVLHPGISIGVAVLPQDGRTVDELTRHADSALYRAKAGGRHRVAT